MPPEINPLSHEDQQRLRGFADRIDAAQRQIDGLNAAKAKIYAGVRAAGLDAKVLRRVVADRGRDQAEYQRERSRYAVYAQVLGLAPSESSADSLARVHAREANIANGHSTSSELNPWPKPADPRCRKPELCGGYSARALCDGCKDRQGNQPDDTLNSVKEN